MCSSLDRYNGTVRSMSVHWFVSRQQRQHLLQHYHNSVLSQQTVRTQSRQVRSQDTAKQEISVILWWFTLVQVQHSPMLTLQHSHTTSTNHFKNHFWNVLKIFAYGMPEIGTPGWKWLRQQWNSIHLRLVGFLVWLSQYYSWQCLTGVHIRFFSLWSGLWIFLGMQ